MGKFIMVLLACLCLLVSVSAAHDMQSFLNTSAWQLEYEVSFVVDTQGTYAVPEGSLSYTVSMNSMFNGALTLDLRSDGPNLSTIRMVSASPDGGAPSAAQQQKLMEMMMHADAIANWIAGGADIDDDESDEAQQAAITTYMTNGHARLEYTRVDTGVGLVDEMGEKFNRTIRTTMKGEGPVMTPTQLVFELDSRTGAYLLSLSTGFGDRSENSLHKDVVTRIESAGEAPSESTESNDLSLVSFPRNIVIDAPIMMGDVPIMEGTADPKPGKITGEKSVKAHYDESFGPCTGTLTFRYTLTPR